MKKVGLLSIITVLFVMMSCEQEVVTYSDCLEKEKTIIDKFMTEHKFKVLKVFPDDGVFRDKEFVLLDNGVYIHVIDSGNGNRPTTRTEIESIAKGQILYKDSTRCFDGFQNNEKWAEWPIKFKHNDMSSSNKNYYFLGEGYSSAMNYVGDSSSVSMIVPFTVGSIYQYSTFIPIYFEKIDFTFTK